MTQKANQKLNVTEPILLGSHLLHLGPNLNVFHISYSPIIKCYYWILWVNHTIDLLVVNWNAAKANIKYSYFFFFFFLYLSILFGLPGGSAVKESAYSAGDLGLILGLGRSLGEGNGYTLQYSGLDNSMDCIVHEVTKSWMQLSNFHFHFYSMPFAWRESVWLVFLFIFMVAWVLSLWLLAWSLLLNLAFLHSILDTISSY